jgi:hypothetical protein
MNAFARIGKLLKTVDFFSGLTTDPDIGWQKSIP